MRRAQNVQELRRASLKTDEEVKNATEDDEGNERDGNVDERQRRGLDERVVHRRAEVLENDGSLSEQSRDLGHSRQSSEQKSTVNIHQR